MKRETLLWLLTAMTVAMTVGMGMVAGPTLAQSVAENPAHGQALEPEATGTFDLGAPDPGAPDLGAPDLGAPDLGAPVGRPSDPQVPAGAPPAAGDPGMGFEPAPSENPFADLGSAAGLQPSADLQTSEGTTPPALGALGMPEAALTPAPPAAPAAASTHGTSSHGRADSSNRESTMTLGPVGIDSHGRRGRIHTVVRGHTLWDISEAYLGTPWVWPSIWDENARISNPHLIFPKDRIWITATEMRLISEEEAEALIATAEKPPALDPAPAPEAPKEIAAEESLIEVPAAMEQLPVRLSGSDRARVGETGEKVHVSWRQSMSFMSTQALEGASSIVESPEARTWLAERDSVYVGLGEGDVAKGDRFTIFQDPLAVHDPVDGSLLGYHVDVLGHLEIIGLAGETSIGQIVESVSEIQRGALLVPYEPIAPIVSVKRAPQALEGRIVFMPANRRVAAQTDYVYLNRGAIHGLEIGSGLQVVDHGGVEFDRARSSDVLTPDITVADLVVVSVQPDSAAALVTHATRELSAGDTVRGAGTNSVR